MPRPAIAGGSSEADDSLGAVVAGQVEVEELDRRESDRLLQPEVVALAVLCAGATLFFGVYPEPLLDLARDAGAVLTGLF